MQAYKWRKVFRLTYCVDGLSSLVVLVFGPSDRILGLLAPMFVGRWRSNPVSIGADGAREISC